MIVVSLVLIVVAVILLAVGLAGGINEYLVGSIAASLLAAMALIVSGRQHATRRALVRSGTDEGLAGVDELLEPAEPRIERATVSRQRETPARSGAAVVPAAPTRGGDRAGSLDGHVAAAVALVEQAPVTPAPRTAPHAPEVPAPRPAERVTEAPGVDAGAEDDDLMDEPPAQSTSAGDAARVALLPAEVLVIDGRPRYHLGTCLHLLGRAGEPLPAREAIELGFTPCGLCEPDTALLGTR